MNKSRGKDESVIVLKQRISTLEGEVSKYKQRLDDLRKAKNNLIVKREREVIEIGQPNLGRSSVDSAKYQELERKLAYSESTRVQQEKNFQTELSTISDEKNEIEKSMNSLMEEHKLEIERLKAELREKGAIADDASSELKRLREKLEVKAMQEEGKHRQNTDRESYISDLLVETASLREKVINLTDKLSEKEALWLQETDRAELKKRELWDEKYAKWMAATDKKMEELRQINALLKIQLAERTSNANLPTNNTTSTSND